MSSSNDLNLFSQASSVALFFRKGGHEERLKDLFANYMDKISLSCGSDLVVAISEKPQA